MKAYLRKLPGGLLAAETDSDSEAIAKLKVGEVIKVEWTRPKNYQFHKKLYALANLAYDAWEPVEKEHKGVKIEKNFEQFREDITILAGFYDTHIRLNGDIRFTAKSWSFEKMEDTEKERLYSAIINVVLSRILTKYTRDDLDLTIEKLLTFC